MKVLHTSFSRKVRNDFRHERKGKLDLPQAGIKKGKSSRCGRRVHLGGRCVKVLHTSLSRKVRDDFRHERKGKLDLSVFYG